LLVDRAHAPNPSIGTLIARARTSDRSSPRHDPSEPIRVVLADDSYLIREALHEVIGSIDAIDLVGSFGDGESLLAAIEADPPDVVITDIRMPPSATTKGSASPGAPGDTPEVGVVVLSQYAGHRPTPWPCSRTAPRARLPAQGTSPRSERAAVAIEVVAQGGTTIDPSVVQELLAAGSPAPQLAARRADAARARGPCRDGPGPQQRLDRRVARLTKRPSRSTSGRSSRSSASRTTRS
jgi:DNA-binding NarL/FixJ family response regulator